MFSVSHKLSQSRMSDFSSLCHLSVVLSVQFFTWLYLSLFVNYFASIKKLSLLYIIFYLRNMLFFFYFLFEKNNNQVVYKNIKMFVGN